MTSPLPLLPTVDRAAVWRCVPTPDPVAFIVIDDGYRPTTGDPVEAAEYVEATDLPVTPYITYYAATMGAYPPPTATSNPEAYAHLQYLRRFMAVGRGVQCHARTHLDLTGVETGAPALTYDQQLNEIKKGKDFVARGDAFGPVVPTLLRPPYGRWNDDTRRAAYTAGIKVITLWTHAYNEFATKPVQAGAILLTHFGADLLAQLEAAVTAISAAGLTPAFIEDYVK